MSLSDAHDPTLSIIVDGLYFEDNVVNPNDGKKSRTLRNREHSFLYDRQNTKRTHSNRNLA
jgi:hypothetical protein